MSFDSDRFASLFPGIEDAQIEYQFTDGWPGDSPEYFPSISLKDGLNLNCIGPCDSAGYFDMAKVVKEMVEGSVSEKKGSLTCRTDTPIPRGADRSLRCYMRLNYRIRIRWRGNDVAG